MSPSERPLRVLSVASRFNWAHIDYLAALSERFELLAAHIGEREAGVVEHAGREGLPLHTLATDREDTATIRTELSDLVRTFSPDAVHVFYSWNEAITVLARELAPARTVVVHECRDPLTTMTRAGSDSPQWRLEREALQRSDGQIFVSRAIRSYFERLHGLELGADSIVVPHGYALRTAGTPAAKLSAADGETHLALVGTADSTPGHGRYYVEIIERLTGLGFVVHTHFHDLGSDGNRLYRDLADHNPRYRYHAAVPFRHGTSLSQLVSRYDLMGVFHDLEGRPEENESATLAVCMPTKAVCGWFHGGVPVVCFRHYRGLVELIEEHAIGFVANRWRDVGDLVGQRDAIADATARTLAVRERFSNEWNAVRIEKFFRALRARRLDAAI